MSNKELTLSSSNKTRVVPTTKQIIEQMQEEDEARERDEILNKMTDACRKKLEYFEDWLRKESDHILRRRYELGLHVLELYEDEENNRGKKYGKNAIGRICKLIGWDDGVIRMALRFVQAFTQDDLERLCTTVLTNGEPLTWTHIRSLLQVSKAETRQTLLERTVAENWTTDQLAHEIVYDKRAQSLINDGRGRPPRIPKNFDNAVALQEELADQWDRYYTKVWVKPERSLATHAAKLSAEEVTEERLREANDLAFRLRRVATEATEQAEKAEQIVKEFALILDQREKTEQADHAVKKATGETN